MKLHTGINVVEKSGEQESQGFSIEASAKAFFILSDGLYSNKVEAVIRELSTNAYDSHVDAGVRDKPFDVHVPTRLDPTFYVRDYGTSMSHEDCMQLYTTYFRSTRNDSNDAVGCLGLGSKAPFAYSDSFTVEAYLDGTRRAYTAYKDESGCPVFSLMDEDETDEPNGIKVSLSVESYDIWDFQSEAVEVYKFFNVRPNFVGASVDFDDGTISLSGENWEFEKGSYENFLIMGQISYPIDDDQIKDEIANKFLYSSKGLRIYANIGDVDITPSRESLSYNAATKAKITEIIHEIGLEIATSMEEQISSQESLFQARVKYVALCDQCDSVSVAMKALDTSLSWNDQELFSNMMGNAIETGKIHVSAYYKSSWRSKIDVTNGVEKIHFRSGTKFVVNDLKRGGISRTRKYIADTAGDDAMNVYFFNATEWHSGADKFYELLGGATEEDVVLTSSLPKREYNRSSSGGGGGGSIPAHIYDHDEGRFVNCKMSVKYEDAFYIEESRESVNFHGNESSCGRHWSIYEVSNAIEFLTKVGYDLSDKNFYLVKPSVIRNSKLAERDNWSRGDYLIASLVEDVMNDNLDNLNKVYNRYHLADASDSKWAEVLELTKTDNEAKKIVVEYNEYMAEIDEIKEDMSKLNGLIHDSGLKWDRPDPAEDHNSRFVERFDEAMEKYPMLDEVGGHWMDSDTKQNCADYIDLVENCGGK